MPVRIGFVLELDRNGVPLTLIDMRDHTGRKAVAPQLLMPEVSRTSGIRPAFLWDKTAYALGLTRIEVEDDSGKRTVPATPSPAHTRARIETDAGAARRGSAAVARSHAGAD